LRQFGRDLRDHRLDVNTLARTTLYAFALRGIFERGRVEAMPPGPYRWRLGITEHCLPCFEASRVVYQKNSRSGLGLPVLPGSPGDGSVCNGLTRCGCEIVLASGMPIPGQDLADRMRGLLLEVLSESRTASEGDASPD
jgi:hypothetical protein